MKYNKRISNGYIVSVDAVPGDSAKGNITEAEYNEVLRVIQSCPNEAGYGYRLKTDLTWEKYERIEPPVEEELTAEEALDIILGGAV